MIPSLTVITNFRKVMNPQESLNGADFAAFTAMVKALRPLDEDTRQRTYAAIGVFFNVSRAQVPSLDETPTVTDNSAESGANLADFIDQANTKTDLEISLIAVYWLQYRQENADGSKTFKTRAIGKELEAAGHKFSNLAWNLKNLAGTKKKYLICSGSGRKEKTWRVSARGKKVVEEMLHGQN